MNQLSLIDDPYTRQVWSTGEMALSVSKSQPEILRWISKLYNDGQPFECDATFSKGKFYKDFPEPHLKFDLYPQRDDVQEGRMECLPLADESLGSLVLDPPFVLKNPQRKDAVTGIIEGRFWGFPNWKLLCDAYKCALYEAQRVLRPGGILVFKCQNQVSGSKQRWIHPRLVTWAEDETRLVPEDEFILLATSVLWSPNMRPETQAHARKIHSFFLVFRKE